MNEPETPQGGFFPEYGPSQLQCFGFDVNGGLNDYLYYVGGSLLYLWYSGRQNPILIIKAPMLMSLTSGLNLP